MFKKIFEFHNRIIRWLNRLNGGEDIEVLADDYEKEFAELLLNVPESLQGLSFYHRNTYDTCMLSELCKYSTRGELLSTTLKHRKNNQNKLTFK